MDEGKTFPQNPNVEIYTTSKNTIKADIHEAIKRGHFIIGESSFWASSNNAHKVKDAAIKKGADLVLYFEEYRNTTTNNTSISMPDTQTTYHSGNVYTPNTYGSYSGTSTTYGTTQVPISVTHHYYDYDAVFFKKLDPKPKIGYNIDECDEKKRRIIERNECIFVSVIFYDTPAFRQNLMEGDIITKINDYKINNWDTYERFKSQGYQNVTLFKFEVIRNGENKQIIIDTTK